MGLIEAVTGKGFHLVKDIVGEFVTDTAMGGTINKHETLLGHLAKDRQNGIFSDTVIIALGAGGLAAFSASSSTQSLTLPGPVRVDQMKMEYKNGRLEVTLPKS